MSREPLAPNPEKWARDAIGAIAERAVRTDASPTSPTLDETSWAVGRLSDEGIERLSTFLHDLTRRAPFTSTIWDAHRLVLEALDGDLRRELEKRQAAETATLNGRQNGKP